MGYVIQHAGLFPHRTIIDNIATVPYLLGWDKKKARSRAMELLERVGLDTRFARRYPSQLSGGQQQRVGVARALAADPPVMLMDEPFSAVDPVVRDQLQAEFLRLQEDLGKTIVFVTHDIDEAIKLGDQVAVLRVGGHLAQLATPADLLTRPVDAFVAAFVGRDRGYRALGFDTVGTLSTHPEQTVTMGSRVPTGADNGPWILVVDGANVPQGWLDLDTVKPGETVVIDEMLYRGGTLATQGGSLRAALDACLSSPSGRGVVVDENSALLGSITAREVLDLIEHRQPEPTA
jgi:osmoprotectant transport system ATP-binding protein